ncbi:MAG: class I SAM-dependent methyltransferase [Minisyncoccota bacterium]
MNGNKTKWNDSFIGGRDYSPLNEVLIDAILASSQNDRNAAVDLGCGTGDAVTKLAIRGVKVIGVDWSVDALEKAKARAKNAGVVDKVSFIEADLDEIEQVGIEKNSMNIVLCKLVISFVKDRRAFFEFVKSILSNEGTFILITPVLYDGYMYTAEDKPNIAVQYDEICRTLQTVFSKVKVYNHSYYGERGDVVTFLVSK